MNHKIRELLGNQETQYVFPFFWLKGEEEETLKQYMQVIHDCNIRAICLESRPHPDFCGPGWWHDLDVIIEEAKRLNMKLWILDDSHFPTGYCNGGFLPAIEKGDYSLLRQSLTYRVVGEYNEGDSFSVCQDEIQNVPDPVVTRADQYFMKQFQSFPDDRFLKLVHVPISSDSRCDNKKEDTAGYTRYRVYALYLTRNRGPHRDYMNMLSRASCRMLLDQVYEPHYEHYKEEFGKTILGFFSDEPEIGNGHIYQLDRRFFEVEDQPWSEELEAELKMMWGEDWMDLLPLLWDQDTDSGLTVKVRTDYMDAVTKLVKKDFSEQIGDWCRSHGVMYIGHLIEDHNQHVRLGSSLGHYFRGLAGQDMAGIDDIGGQVLPQGEDLDFKTKWQDHRDGVFYHFALGKLAASAAAIEPLKKGRSMCEIFGNYGWEEGVNLEKYLADHFMVRGVNHFVPHAFSAAPFPDRDCPPHFYAHGNNPQIRHFAKLMKYMERVCHLISDGRPDTQAAILYHAEADWSGGVNMFAEAPGRILAEHQIDYHFIPSDVFENSEGDAFIIDVNRKVFCINEQQYLFFVVPQTDWIKKTAAKGLMKLHEAGIPVIFINQLPKGILDAIHTNDSIEELFRKEWMDSMSDSIVISLEELAALCDKNSFAPVKLTPGSPYIRCLHYIGQDYELYYLVNENDRPWEGKIQLSRSSSDMKRYRYDAWENQIYAVFVDEDCQLDVTLEPAKGYLYLLDADTSKHSEIAVNKENKFIPYHTDELKKWSRSICTAPEYPHFHDERQVELPDRLEQEIPSFGGFVRYETDLRLAETPTAEVILEISGQQEGIEVFVNGVSLGIQIVPTYRYDLTAFLQKGNNHIVIEKATTLERVVPKKDAAGNLLSLPENKCGLSEKVELHFSDIQK